MIPTIGRIVLYKLTPGDAAQAAYRIANSYHGNAPRHGDVYPAMIVRVWGNTAQSLVQLQVFIDGDFTLWATSVMEASQSPLDLPDHPHPERTYIWPTIA